jgi:hypothetical protein
VFAAYLGYSSCMLTDPTSLDLSAFPAKLRGAVSALLRDNTALKSSNVELTEDRIALATQNTVNQTGFTGETLVPIMLRE